MALVLVTGGTGLLRPYLVPRLRDAGHDVRVLSRKRQADGVVGDLTTGDGLDAAVAGVDVIAHCATSPFRRTRETDVEGTRRLFAAVERQGGPMPHVVFPSIVGIDGNPFPYYRQKAAAEDVVTGSGLPWTMIRFTQFHELLDQIFTRMRGALLTFRRVRFQSIAGSDVADRLVELVDGAPAGRVADIGGPEVRGMKDLAGAYRKARGLRRPIVSIPTAGKIARAFKDGANLVPDHAYGTITWEQWLKTRYGG